MLLRFTKYRSASTGLILLYHRVTTLASDPWQLCVSPGNFREQMQWVQENSRVVSVSEMQRALRRRSSQRPLVAVTFDDGYADNLYEALPVLEEYGIPATFFMTVPWLGPPHEFWWDELERIFLQPSELPAVLRLETDPEAPTWHLGEASHSITAETEAHLQWRAWEHPPTLRHEIYAALWKRLYVMPPERRQLVLEEMFEWAAVERSERASHRRLSREEMKTLSLSSIVEIGAHSVLHAPLPSLPPAENRREIEVSRLALTEIARTRVTSFAYPHGDYDTETIRWVREQGFLRGCTTRSGPVRNDQNQFELPRLCVGDCNGEEFAEHLRSWYERPKQPDSPR